MSRKGAANFAGYFRLFRIWFWLGWPAFAGVIAIFALIIWSERLVKSGLIGLRCRGAVPRVRRVQHNTREG